jgi:hypothetical protein
MNEIIVPVKSKRGRKSKKELMETLNMNMELLKHKHNHNHNESLPIVTLNVAELTYSDVIVFSNETNNTYNTSPNDMKEELSTVDEPKVLKKRGRKPKGGKIVQQILPINNQMNDKPNIILHLKCSMKDLNNNTNDGIESFNFEKNNLLNYEIIGNENITINQDFNTHHNYTAVNKLTNNSCDEDDYDNIIKDDAKELWKKIHHLEHNLHTNNISNKRSCCFWDTCEFDNPPVYIPKNYINGTYNVYGCFCSPECAVAYLMDEIIDSSAKFERYHLLNHIYTKVYNYKKNIKPSPNPYYMLDKYYGNLSIQEYRLLLKNERLFLIVDKPLTRILPELHTDNNEFILNNKIIPSNASGIKHRFQRKKLNKGDIINEKFGAVPVQ